MQCIANLHILCKKPITTTLPHNKFSSQNGLSHNTRTVEILHNLALHHKIN